MNVHLLEISRPVPPPGLDRQELLWKNCEWRALLYLTSPLNWNLKT